MKKTLTIGLIIIAVSMTGCTFNFSTGSNNTGPLAANTANMAPTIAVNRPVANQTASNNSEAPVKKEKTNTAPKANNDSTNLSERVQFGSGKTDGNWTREIPANGSIDFVFNAKKGQTIDYTVGYDFKDSDIEAFLTEPGLQDISQTTGPKEPKEFRVNKAGDHRLTVNNTTNKKITMTLYLDIQ